MRHWQWKVCEQGTVTRPVIAVSILSRHTGQVGNSKAPSGGGGKRPVTRSGVSIFTDEMRTTWHISGYEWTLLVVNVEHHVHTSIELKKRPLNSSLKSDASRAVRNFMRATARLGTASLMTLVSDRGEEADADQPDNPYVHKTFHGGRCKRQKV